MNFPPINDGTRPFRLEFDNSGSESSEDESTDGEYSRSFNDDYQAQLKGRRLQIDDVHERYFKIINLHQSADDYIGLHGQALSLMILSDLVKQIEILKCSNPSRYENFEFFRVPTEERYRCVQDFFNTHRTEFTCTDEEGNEINREGSLDDLYSHELLSFDLCPANTQIRESAFYFSAANESMLLVPGEDEEFQPEWIDSSKHPKMIALAKQLLKSYALSAANHRRFLPQIMELAQEAENNNIIIDKDGQSRPGVGNLYLMFLPKALFDEETQSVVYLSMEQGVPYNPEGQGFSRGELLEKLQTCDPEIIEKFTGADCSFFPQGRIICSQLTPETGVRIFKLNALSTAYTKKYEAKVKALAGQIFSKMSRSAED